MVGNLNGGTRPNPGGGGLSRSHAEVDLVAGGNGYRRCERGLALGPHWVATAGQAV
jgi:hypothetical protein